MLAKLYLCSKMLHKNTTFINRVTIIFGILLTYFRGRRFMYFHYYIFLLVRDIYININLINSNKQRYMWNKLKKKWLKLIYWVCGSAENQPAKRKSLYNIREIGFRPRFGLIPFIFSVKPHYVWEKFSPNFTRISRLKDVLM